jgi:beta-glucosidase-like glycosyl hydrolase
VDVEKGFDASQRIKEKSIVLLKNSPTALPINPSKVHTIAIIGGHADVGMISGGGSAQVDPPGGSAIMPPGKGATIWQKPFGSRSYKKGAARCRKHSRLNQLILCYLRLVERNFKCFVIKAMRSTASLYRMMSALRD